MTPRNKLISATTTSLDPKVSQVAISAISGYQKYISPRKGFSCAHRVLYGGDSCSQHVKNLITEHGLIAAVPLTRQRFKNCKTANVILRGETEEERRRRQNNSYSCEPTCNLIEACVDCTPDCNLDCDDPSCNPTAVCDDCTPDCNLDCDSCDCGYS
ncbi:MAG TPA: membrane protein insertion efficiency factor YidD [Halomicronema sp.]